MAKFSTNIEKFYTELLVDGKELKGVWCIQYPLFCIHSIILDSTPDPLLNFDKIVVSLFQTKPDFSSLQIASIVGCSKSMVEYRINELIKDGILDSKKGKYELTELGVQVFVTEEQVHQHKRSYDFYVDGITLKPLPSEFYNQYRSKFITDDEIEITDSKSGKTFTKNSFSPDLVHTPPDKEKIISQIFNIDQSERKNFEIPEGLETIEDISFTKITFQLLVAVSKKDDILCKELIDGFAYHSVVENYTYYESLRRNVLLFEPALLNKIKNLEFRITLPKFREDTTSKGMPSITTNWAEIDKYNSSENRCFAFSTEDLSKFLHHFFNLNDIPIECIINQDQEIRIDITRSLLIGSSNRPKLISALIRKREFKMVNPNKNVYLIFLNYATTDKYVLEVLRFKSQVIDVIVNKNYNVEIVEKYTQDFKFSYRELLAAAGEFEILENLDIEKYMTMVN
ncbi:MAG: hypothetical protein M0D53_00745 [Flavobacterium sp. JAD_PAG50586_2]|nr:MAG: hypothetical protein M0D53_00745 [Flavobacterium sp. JAD_PAG50586_2]